MTAFFISIIFIGILVVCIAFILVFYEKKKAHDYRLDLEERKHELIEVISDAEQLLIELNKFSDYIVTEIENKYNALETSLAMADEKLKSLNQISSIEDKTISENSNAGNIQSEIQPIFKNHMGTNDKQKKRKSYKVISLNEKRREVIKLSKSGLSSAEIARMLNMGKGEIELIYRMCK